MLTFYALDPKKTAEEEFITLFFKQIKHFIVFLSKRLILLHLAVR